MTRKINYAAADALMNIFGFKRIGTRKLTGKYTITYDDGKIKQSTEFPVPDRLPQPGDVYEITIPVWSLGNVDYEIGDRLEILRRTKKAPHHRTSSLGNLSVRCKYMTSVWANIELMIVDGHLKLV